MPTELPELESILHSGILNYGNWGREFEKLLRGFIGTQNVLTTNTYSNAIHIALATLGLVPGDEVIASPMACLASNQPLLSYGLNVKWADIDPSTGTLDPDSVKHNISSKTKLIFHNHFCGYVGYVEEVNDIAHHSGLLVIDDCVEAFGSTLNGKCLGNLGTDASVFSFQTVRLPNTIDGGAIAFSDKNYMERASLVRDFGIDRSRFRDRNFEISENCDISLKGYAGTMSDVNSYIGCLQMNKIDELLQKQRYNAEYWSKTFANSSSIHSLSVRNNVCPNYWVYGILSDDKEKDMLLYREKGYYCSGVHLPNNYYSVFGDFVKLCGVKDFYKRFLALPCGWWF